MENSTGQRSGRPADRRRFGRRSVFKHASIVDEGSGQTACIVVDISDDGARLKVDDTGSVPDRFGLAIEEDDFGVRCEVVRRELQHLGVRFIGSPRRLSWLRRRSRVAARVSAIVRNSTE